MTRFESPALQQPGLPLAPIAMRGLLAAAATLCTAVLWVAAASQAGQFGERETAVRVTLPPVVISAVRSPASATAAMGARPAAGGCEPHGTAAEAAGPIRVNLNQ